jgi:hypothetical protein
MKWMTLGWNPRWRGKKTLKNKIKNKKKKLGKNGIFRFSSPHHVMARFTSLPSTYNIAE